MNDKLNQNATLCDVLDRILNQGVVVHGEITISVAGVDLLYVSLRGLVSAVDAIAQHREPSAKDKALLTKDTA
jgi:gas vesicle structural protein